APQYHLSFGGDGRVAGRSGCNRFAGTYRARRGRLDIGRLMSTRMACAPAVMRGERRFLGALRSSRFYRLSASGLVLAGASGAPLLRLVPDRRR
ncbi:MAG: lipoprotein-related protein, partial [Hyphomicrobiales bacterium]